MLSPKHMKPATASFTVVHATVRYRAAEPKALTVFIHT